MPHDDGHAHDPPSLETNDSSMPEERKPLRWWQAPVFR